jgi:uncharacterized protein
MRGMLRQVVLFMVFPAFLWSQASSDLVVENDVSMKARDGVLLRADLYRPAGDGKFPALLTRTPYDKSTIAEFARRLAAHGFLVVVQDVRGRFASDGEWYPFRHETADGYDAVEWVASLPQSNGKVGMFGGSYVGATQLLAAIGKPPHLAGICTVATASNYHENWAYQGGAFEQWFAETWISGLAENTLVRQLRKATDPMAGIHALPLTSYPLINARIDVGPGNATEKLAPYLHDWLAHPQYDSYWKPWAIDEHYDAIDVPSLTVAAWYDIFQGGSLANYTGLSAHAPNAEARANRQLMITIGGHAGTGRKIGDVDFGPEAARNYDDVTLAWYEYLFYGKQNEFADGKPVKLFAMGENKWRAEASWPLERAKSVRYYLHSSGHANSDSGDGSLSSAAPRAESADRYTYDPADAVPTVGGPLCCGSGVYAAGPRDQSTVESRKDVLVYSTPALAGDVEVTGPVALDLFVSSSAVDTDFTAKLVDVWPNGFAQNLTEGILRASYRASHTVPEPLVPEKIYRLSIDLWSTSNVFLKGHKIRIEVSSSNFPRFDRNLNTGRAANTDRDFVIASNMVFHDTEHPSAIVLPIVPRVDAR